MRRCAAFLLLGLLVFGADVFADVDWGNSYHAALEKAGKENKLIMVDMYVDWCGPCKLLDKDTFASKDVQARLSKGFIAVKIDIETNKEGLELAKQFGGDMIPHILFFDSGGKIISDVIGYVPPKKFLKKLEDASEKAAKK
jgi:thiol:disulfide interchange protein